MRLKTLGTSYYRVFHDTHEVGEVRKIKNKWVAHPFTSGHPSPSFATTTHSTRQEAIDRLVRHFFNADE